LFALFALAPILIIAHPSVPIFGGTKHWLTAYPFLALAAAAAWVASWRHLPLRGRAAASLPALALLTPPRPRRVEHHRRPPLSALAPTPRSLGGARGAAERGLLRGFWGHDLPPSVLTEPGAPIYLHDLHELARQQYIREGRWPTGLTPATPARARQGLLFHERHMLSLEIQLWESLHTTAPAEVVTLDDVPLTSLYRE
jgi:hypothetical protein